MTSTERHVRALAASAGYRGIWPLARAAGLDRGTIQRALTGRQRPSAETLRRLASVLGCDARELGVVLGGLTHG